MEENLSNQPNNVMSDSFLRQRRNLFIINLVALFMMLAQVQANKITLGGLSFEKFGNPKAIFIFLWAFWMYFLYRFFLYFFEDEWSKVKKTFSYYFHFFHDRKYRSLLKKSGYGEYFATFSYSQLRYNNFNTEIQFDYNPVTEEYKKDLIYYHPRQFLLTKLRFLNYFLLFTTVFTNYLFPFLLSLFTLFIASKSGWEGSIFRLSSFW